MINRIIISLMFVCMLTGCAIAPPPPPPLPKGDYRPINKLVIPSESTQKKE